MSYQGYVIAAYLVFAAVLLWDFVAPRIAIRQQARAATLRATRLQSSRAGNTPDADADDQELRR